MDIFTIKQIKWKLSEKYTIYDILRGSIFLTFLCEHLCQAPDHFLPQLNPWHSDGDFSLRLILSSTSIINNLSVWYMLICWLILIIKSKILCRWSESWETNKQLLFWDLIVDYTRRWARYAIVNYLGGPATKSFEGSPKFLREEYSLMQVSNG